MEKRTRCAELFLTFFKIGLFTFGGGYAMLSMIESELAERRGWVTQEEIAEICAIAESTPGPIAVNSATYVGYQRAGAAGSACATLGVVLPSFVIIYVISLFLERFMALTAVANAFKGIRVAVAFLILRTGTRLTRKLPGSVYARTACALAAGAVLWISLTGARLSAIWLILAGAAAGLLPALRGGGGA